MQFHIARNLAAIFDANLIKEFLSIYKHLNVSVESRQLNRSYTS